MSVNYAKSTYQEFISEIIADFHVQPKIAKIQKEQFQQWANRAMEQICANMVVQERFTLHISNNVDEYLSQDRPPITAGTLATPAVITAAGHGLSTGDRIFVRDVVGLLAANGYRQVTVSGNNLSLYNFGDVEDATNESPIVLKITAHPFVSTDLVTVTGVVGNTAANVANNAIVVVDADHISLTGTTGNGAYVSGGTATAPVVGDAAYVSGGRLWKTNEIPTYFKRLRMGRRNLSGYNRTVGQVEITRIPRMAELDYNSTISYTQYESPYWIAPFVEGGIRKWKMYPVPMADEDILLYGWMGFNSRYWDSVTLDTVMPLDYQFEEMMTAYIRSRIFMKLGDPKARGDELNLFVTLMGRFTSRNVDPGEIRMEYS